MDVIKATAALVRAIQHAWTRKWSFLAAFLIAFFVVVRLCTLVGLVPDASAADNATSSGADGTTVVTPNTLGGTSVATAADAAGAGTTNTSGVAAQVSGDLNMSGELPTKVVIPSIGVNTAVDNPATTNVDSLDNYLLSAAVRYPTSATLDQQGNVIIFGHSSYLPVVINQHFKTFDGIQNLQTGDLIYVYSSQHEYVYSVTSEQKESELTDSIPLTTTGHTLTLATCDSFTSKTDRFIVTATLVGSSALGN
ncbi:MAG: sortase [Candidatus Pacebacteria bacterium]|nr:sortase [Candidatus Paceibacterota bacterium]